MRKPFCQYHFMHPVLGIAKTAWLPNTKSPMESAALHQVVMRAIEPLRGKVDIELWLQLGRSRTAVDRRLFGTSHIFWSHSETPHPIKLHLRFYLTSHHIYPYICMDMHVIYRNAWTPVPPCITASPHGLQTLLESHQNRTAKNGHGQRHFHHIAPWAVGRGLCGSVASSGEVIQR